MRAFHFYVDDWLSSKNVRRMDAYEERGYLRLLLYAASEPDCGLPPQADELADISLLGAQWDRVTATEDKRFRHQTSGEKLKACFFVMQDGLPVNAFSGEPELKIDERVDLSVLIPGRLYNARLLREFQYQKEAQAQRSEAGKASAESRRRQRAFDERSNDRSTTVGFPLERDGQRNGNNDVIRSSSSYSSSSSSSDDQQKSESTSLSVVIETVANNVHARHPAKRRNFSPWQIADQLRMILGFRPIRGDPEKAEYLLALDERHRKLCQSEDWQEQGGKYAKGLRNWLKPEDGLYDIEPAGHDSGGQELTLDQKAAIQKPCYTGDDPTAEYHEFMRSRLHQQRAF